MLSQLRQPCSLIIDDDSNNKTIMMQPASSYFPSNSTPTRQSKHPGFLPSSFRPAAVIDVYFPVYLAGRIDHGHHDGKAVKALNDAKAMNEAVENAMKLVDKGKLLHDKLPLSPLLFLVIECQ